MNGVHDMGGMHGLGPIVHEQDEPVFHERWEARMFGINQSMTFPRGTNLDRWRFERETMPPAEYLAQSYYEHWWFIAASLLLKAGQVTNNELISGRAEAAAPRRMDAMRAEAVAPALRARGKMVRPVPTPPRFAEGQPVLTRNLNPEGHTRLPRYARGKRGQIHRRRGGHVFPDSNARGQGEQPQHLYSVAFSARELWGADRSANDQVFLDLWESYLEPA
jgi:nitrile hydratase subunit beta